MADGAHAPTHMADYDEALVALDAAKDAWAQTTTAERIALLEQVKTGLMQVADDWVAAAARGKMIPEGSPLTGEEWTSGPYAVMFACNGLIQTLRGMEGKAYLDSLSTRELVTGQTAVQVLPYAIWDHLLLSGVRAEVWMQPGVTRATLRDHAASAYDLPPEQRRGKVALVLGAGNIAAISPLDVFQKLFLENQVCILKMNPVNDYLTGPLQVALKPLIDRDFVRIVKGDGAAGAYLTTHPLIEEMHITGAGATHDAIVWGTGDEAVKNKANGTPKNARRFTSELGAVCPTIVVPGPWSRADLNFQAQNVATQKLHNSGFNCVACQVLILPVGWDQREAFMAELRGVMERAIRPAYYPGAEDRLADFNANATDVTAINRGAAPACVINNACDSDWFRQTEVFAPAMSTQDIDAPDAETFLKDAIAYANAQLHGTLGANIVIHPRTIRRIGKRRFEEIVAELSYGTIAINAWSGLAFLISACPWGGFPGHTLEDVGSGIGTVHNTFMLEDTERTVIQAPWRPFPRGLLSGSFSLLPKPPWFITNRRQDKIGRALTRMAYKPSLKELPAVLVNALRG